MSRLGITGPNFALNQHEGLALFSAPAALLKGLLEAESEVSLVAGPRASMLGALVNLADDPAVALLLRQHNVQLLTAPEAGRAIALAAQAARSGRAALAIVPNDQLDLAIDNLRQASATPMDRGGALTVLLEDDPRAAPATCPRRAAMRVGLPAIEVADLRQLRDAIEQSLRLSRASRSTVAVIVHQSIMRSSDTLVTHPNRVMGPVEAVLMRRRRPRVSRSSETGGALRMARRMELNQFRAIPSPGEQVSVGFIAVGPAFGAIMHLAHILGLHGRVPVLQLGLIQPVDEAAVGRLLNRCQQVIVLEPRPGSIEARILDVAEAMRRQGQRPATVWGRTIPTDSGTTGISMASDADLHPSVLVRKIAHLLHAIRPTIQVASQLMPEPPSLPMTVPVREAGVGSNASLTVIRRMVTDVDQWLRERTPWQEQGVEQTTLAIDGAETPGAAGRVVIVETWGHQRFERQGIAAMVQAARDDRPWIMLVCESASEEIRDLERFARGAVPAERADRVVLLTANLDDRQALRDLVREATLVDRLSVIIVRDGPPPHYDTESIERSLSEIDRLGFEPKQRLIHPADEVCAIRPALDVREQESPGEHDSSSMQSVFTVESLNTDPAPKVRFRVRPLLEEVEVVRTRPPRGSWQSEAALRLAPPQAVHGKQPLWRAHLAGLRGNPPGAAAQALIESGRIMGYHVRSVHDPSPIAPGRRAWTQVLFTHPREGEDPLQVTASIPYGEADLLLGFDSYESLRAVGADHALRIAGEGRTYAVVNVDPPGRVADQPALDHAQVAAAISAVSRPEIRMIEDFVSASRTWFYSDRVGDMAMLGAAFQLGLIPVTVDAIEDAVALVESRGFGRSREAFEFGRRLTVDTRLFSKPKDDREEDVDRLARRMVLSLSRREWGGGSKARRFHALIHGSMAAMPGLTETDDGRRAVRDYVMALYRCVIWGGIDYAQQYADLIKSLYLADRGDRGRLLTRSAVLPLAESMLMRDPIYIASMAASTEQRRRTHQQLNVKKARGDRLERRYLTRMELIAFKRRIRADVRSSDWPARLVALGRRVMPRQWRGSLRERELREYLMGFVRRAIDGAADDYSRWSEAMKRLHLQAAEDRLRGMAMAEVRMLVEPAAAIAPSITPAA